MKKNIATMPNTSLYKIHRGSTLFMSMMLLLAVSILTFSSLEGSRIFTRVSANYVTNERTVQAAESAIERILAEGNKLDTNRFVTTFLTNKQVDCLTKDDLLPAVGKCQQITTFDSYGLLSGGAVGGNNLIAGALTQRGTTGPADGYDTRNFENQMFNTSGASFYQDALKVNQATEYQLDWKRWGPKKAFNVQDLSL